MNTRIAPCTSTIAARAVVPWLQWGLAGLLAATASVQAAPLAGTYVNDVTFQTTDQSIWGTGSDEWTASTFLGKTWGTYAGQSPWQLKIGGIWGSANADCWLFTCDTRTGAEVALNSSGKLGIVPYAGASGGSLGATVPVHFAVNAPVDTITAKTIFTVSAQGSVLSNASLNTVAPSFKAGVDGYIKLDNSLSGNLCFIFAGCLDPAPTTFNLGPGQFNILGLDTSKIKPFSIGGAEFALPGVNGKNVPFDIRKGPSIVPLAFDPSPVIGSVQVYTGTPDHAGGTVSGDVISLATDENVLRVGLSIPGIAQVLALPELPVSLFKQTVTIPGLLTLSGTLFDANAGLTFGMHQAFSLDTNPEVQLQFSTGVWNLHEPYVDHYSFTNWLTGKVYTSDTTTLPNGCYFLGLINVCNPAVPVMGSRPVFHDDGLIDLFLGQTFDLSADADVQLLSRTYLLDDPQLTNATSASIDPDLRLQALCGTFYVVSLVDKTACVFDHDYRTTDLVNIPIHTTSFTLGGFSPVTFEAGPFDPIPEPPAWALAALALAGLSALHRRAAGRRLNARAACGTACCG